MYAETLSRSKLVDQHSIPSHGAPWHRDVLSDIDARLDGDPGFPCLFSKNAYAKGLLKFIFVEGDTDSDIFYLSNCLIEYVELSRHWNGSLNTAYPLVIAFSLAAIHHASLEQYDAFGWNVLQRLHDLDPSPWPSDVGQDLDMAGWSMCFHGMPLFCNMSHPAHHQRRSRNLGTHFTMVVNPRERFDVVAGDTPAGHKVRNNIRSRIANYDDVSHSPQLAAYGAGGIEWWQYSLAEENLERTDRCPFRGAKPRS
jgi:FPC/CPF motif-containing protein YcgG